MKESKSIPGSSMLFIGREYTRGEKRALYLKDEVIIHPVPGKSQAKKSYPAMIDIEEVKGQDVDARGNIKVLIVRGIKGNKHIAWMNDYLFSRLEFVKRNYHEIN